MAPDITVGDDHPQCDTYTHAAVSPVEEQPYVAHCDVVHCSFNDARN